ncbi:gustatory receptor [Anopheles darlingi]|uniref:Gustatory receptor n=1 Tax=Anopheles darlingi TaxID=43151 RepID=W5J858_ANODA|nr:gustatory receptor [Anopheles darlingi]
MIEVDPGVRFPPLVYQGVPAANGWQWLRKRRNVTFVRAAEDIDGWKERFHLAIGSVLRWARLFGVFPLTNITASNDSDGLQQFRYLSFPVLLCALAAGGGVMVMIAALVRLERIGFNALNIAEPIFYGMCTLLNILFVRLALQWREFMRYWNQREEFFFARPYGAVNLRRRVLSMTSGVLGLAFVEHVMYVINQVHNVHQESLTCRYNASNPIRLYAMLTFSSVYSSFPYHPLLTTYLLYITVSLTFLWTFTDLFIMLLATGIACRFGQLNQRIDSNLRSGSQAIWSELRAHYVGLIELTERTNRVIGPLVIVSCANDMYFLCLQTLNTVEAKASPINEWYFRYSFTFLILRTSLKLWYTAEVAERSMQTHKLVQKIRSEFYNDELDILRIFSQSGVAISGMGFFEINRKIFLGMAGSILTYELVLLRFHSSSKGAGVDNPCSYRE